MKRLSMHLRSKWADVAHSINGPRTGIPGRDPRFSDLSKFVDEKSRVASSTYGLDLAWENSQCKSERSSLGKHQNNGEKIKVTTLTTNSEGESVKREHKCGCCSVTCSDLTSCETLKAINLNDRHQLQLFEGKTCIQDLQKTVSL